jgi:hypothetical protein
MFRRTSHPTRIVVVAGFLLCARTVHAYRPFDGTDGDVAETGEFELELGPVHYLQEGKDKSLLAPLTVLNLGVIPRMELVLDFTNTLPLDPGAEARFQITDTDFFTKILLRRGVLQEETGPSVALETGPLLPEVNGEPGFGLSLNIIVSERFGWLVLHLNNEAELSRGSLGFEWMTSLIAEAELGGPVRPVAELLWERALSEGGMRYTVLGGAIWTVAEDLALDAAAVVGDLEGELVFEARLGLTWSVPIWEPAEDKQHEHDEADHDDHRADR